MLKSKDGSPIQLIINPCSFPKRKTIAYQVEQAVSIMAVNLL